MRSAFIASTIAFVRPSDEMMGSNGDVLTVVRPNGKGHYSDEEMNGAVVSAWSCGPISLRLGSMSKDGALSLLASCERPRARPNVHKKM